VQKTAKKLRKRKSIIKKEGSETGQTKTKKLKKRKTGVREKIKLDRLGGEKGRKKEIPTNGTKHPEK